MPETQDYAPGTTEVGSDLRIRQHVGSYATDENNPINGAIAAAIKREAEKAEKEEAKIDMDKMEQSHRLDNLQIAFSILFDISVLIGVKYFKIESLTKLYTLQYKFPDSDTYDRGMDDAYVIVNVMVNLMMVRSILMRFVFSPLAHAAGIHSYKAIQRFKEQGWSLAYYSISWIFGFYIYWGSDYFFSTSQLYATWPHNHMSYLFKVYYLIQTGCWLQQIIVLNIEDKRKDYVQMFCHHIITSMLCIGSYITYFTCPGHAILLLMDIVDVILSFSKILKYSGFGRICDYCFLIFMCSWIVLRHGFYNYIVYFMAFKSRPLMNRDCSRFEPGSDEICYTDAEIDFFVFLLSGLQVITIIWLVMIIRVAITVVKGNSAEDVRSDDENEKEKEQ